MGGKQLERHSMKVALRNVTLALGVFFFLGVDLRALADNAPPAVPASAASKRAARPAYLDLPPPSTPVPAWAFTMDPPESSEFRREPDDDVPRRIEGSRLALTRTHVLDHHDAADWHPEGHPPAPSIVMHGRKPYPTACAFCHLPNGVGLPENAPLAGLSIPYFTEQVHAFQNGSRKTADMRMASFHGMAEVIAPTIREDELLEAAQYYASLKIAKPYLTVIETDTVPKTHSVAYTLVPVPGGGTEPIGNRIIETPRDVPRYKLLDSEVGYFVYVPKGSIAKGRVLATQGGSDQRTTACVVCHGADLRGVGDIPPIAGRSPSNLVRQLYNIKLGARSGPGVALMQPVVKQLTDEDIVNIAAYLASREP